MRQIIIFNHGVEGSSPSALTNKINAISLKLPSAAAPRMSYGWEISLRRSGAVCPASMTGDDCPALLQDLEPTGPTSSAS